MKVDNCNKIPIFLWTENIERSAYEQIENLANLPFAFHHIAIMPDCHTGYGMPIGGVLATLGVVIPNAVGVDIGCGMCAVKTSLKVEQLDINTLKKIMGEIRKVIPVGFNHHKEKQNERLMPEYLNSWHITSREYDSAIYQLGTLGGGNHFIEIQKDKENNIWIMIHSGSRNLGKKVADYYNKIAIELNKKWFSSVSKEWDLAFLPIETQEAKDYMLDMQYCVDFAFENRRLMMERIKQIIQKEYDKQRGVLHIALEFDDIINIAHNYASWENHYGKNVLIHRKGATLARKGTVGIIPGSQGSKSYIVNGLGNKESFESCSHGAGRVMGRKEAQRTLDLDKEVKMMEDKGIIHSIRDQNDLDEAPSAYKDIDKVMDNQKDLVEILTELQPIAVIKG